MAVYVQAVAFYSLNSHHYFMRSSVFARMEDAAIFRDERWLWPEFVPTRLPHRESQINSIALALKPLLRGGKPSNMFLHGRSGTGKTVTTKFVLRDLEETTDRAKSLYLNCFEYNSRHAVLNALANFLGFPMPRRGIATDELYARVLEGIKKADFVPVIVLDEFDQLFLAGDASLLLYDLLRVVEFDRSAFAIIMISNTDTLLAKLDERVRSSLVADQLCFEPYSPQQLKDILKERAEHAFVPGVLEQDVVNVAAAFASKHGGDARLAIEALLRAGRIAESKAASSVTVEHLQQALSGLDSRAIQKSLPYLDEHERTILLLLCDHSPLFSGDLYNLYKQKTRTPLTDRSFRKKLARLQALKLISAVRVERGVRGKRRLVHLLEDPELIKSKLA
jgi:cell division control protein 6